MNGSIGFTNARPMAPNRVSQNSPKMVLFGLSVYRAPLSFSLLAIICCCSPEHRSPVSPDCGCGTEPDSGECDDSDSTDTDGEYAGWHLTWAEQAGGDKNNFVFAYDWGMDVETFSDGSAIVTGRYVSEGMFGVGSPTETLLPSFGSLDSGNTSCFAARWNANGDLVWAKGFGGALWDAGGMGLSTEFDASLNVLGAFRSGAVVGYGEPFETYLSADSFEESGPYSHLLAHFSSEDGSLEWATIAADAAFNSLLTGSVSLPDGSFVISGFFSVGVALAPDTPEETVFTTPDGSDEDALIARFGPDGTLIWAKQIGASGREFASSIARLAGGELIVVGTFEDSVVFGASEESETWLTCDADEADAGTGDNMKCPFIAAYSEDGDLIRVNDPGYSCSVQGLFPEVAAAPNGGFAIAGGFVGEGILGKGEPNETTIGPTNEGDYDVVVAHYSESGQLNWARQITGDVADPGDVTIQGMYFPLAFLESGELVLSGHYKGGSPVFGNGEPNETILPTCNKSQIFISLYSPSGVLEWAVAQHGPNNMNSATSIAADGPNTFFVTGSFGDTVTFGTSPTDEVTMSSIGDSDIFLLRFHRTEESPR